MEYLATIADLRRFSESATRPLGLVPTMGALHEGHLSLVRRAKQECSTVVITLFINPAQFGDQADFEGYPRDHHADVAVLETIGVDAVFAPQVEEMYPNGFATALRIRGPALPLEGQSRPGHFDGVAIVVTKLLFGALADRAYFGQKDGQQLAVVRRLVADLGIPTEIIPMPTVREPDGLALSSRNQLLTPEQRAGAPALYTALLSGARAHAAGERNREVIVRTTMGLLEMSLKAGQLTAVEYVALVDQDTIEPWTGGPGMLAGAVCVGHIRLIDNMLLDDGHV